MAGDRSGPALNLQGKEAKRKSVSKVGGAGSTGHAIELMTVAVGEGGHVVLPRLKRRPPRRKVIADSYGDLDESTVGGWPGSDHRPAFDAPCRHSTMARATQVQHVGEDAECSGEGRQCPHLAGQLHVTAENVRITPVGSGHARVETVEEKRPSDAILRLGWDIDGRGTARTVLQEKSRDVASRSSGQTFSTRDHPVPVAPCRVARGVSIT